MERVRNSKRPDSRKWFWILLAALPFLSIYAIHANCLGSASTGFIQADQPYYVANGRAIFERGSGLTYPNPFDSNPDSPAIYFHWPMLLGGIAVKFVGLDPGAWYVSAGLIFALLMSSLTWNLVQLHVRAVENQAVCFLFVMWAGGLFTAAALLSGARPTALDHTDGFWMQNWGRNLIFSYEALYHSLVVGAWISLLEKRWKRALGFIWAVLAAHPFTGTGLLVGLAIWIAALKVWRPKEPIPRIFLAGLLAGAVLFGAYYFVFLPSFPSHRLLMEQWRLPWALSSTQILLALAPVGLLSLFALYKKRELDSGDFLFLSFFISAILLSNHHLVMRAIQPVHFTRGYTWLPLAILSIPLVEKGAFFLRKKLGKAAPGALGFIIFLAALDNLGFLAQNAETCVQHIGLAPEAREIFRLAERDGLRGVLYSPHGEANLLTPTYTGMRAYSSHIFLTPDAQKRNEEVTNSLREGKVGPWLSSVDYLLVHESVLANWLNLNEWITRFHVGGFRLLERRAGYVKSR